ncbi:MAG: type VII secretion protein EssC [Lachnospiraceae bacterium]|nr:type VII secretion protein EssC [Lachnospiraceae bacterium]
MSLFMTVFFENGFSEHFFPAVDNRKYPVAVNSYISGLDDELVLGIEVWDGKWTIYADKKYELLRDGKAVESAVLEPGLVLEGTVKKGEVWFSVKIDEAGEETFCFSKYLLNRENVSAITIGSDERAGIYYKNKYVSDCHAVISFEGEKAFVEDKGSVNGTFLNGRCVSGKLPIGYGDVIYVVGLKVVYLGNLIAINHPSGSISVNTLKQIEIPSITDDGEEEEYEKTYFLRTPRHLREINCAETVIERCFPKQNHKPQPLIFTIGPSFCMVIPIAIAAMMSGENGFGASSIVMSAGAAGMAAVWAVINSSYNKKEAANSESERQKKYTEYIAAIENDLSQLSEYNRGVLTEQYPSVKEMLDFVSSNKKRLWEKSSTHRDFLSVRVGIGDILSPNHIVIQKENITQTYDPLNDLGENLRSKYLVLEKVPVSVSLYENRIIGLVSKDPEKRKNLLRLLALNLAANFTYTEVRMCFAFKSGDYDELNYTRWLPHSWSPDGKVRMVAYDRRSLGDVMYYLSDVIRERVETAGRGSNENEEKVLPHYIIFVTDISVIAGEPVSKYLMDPPKEAGITVVFCGDSAEGLPSKCETVIEDGDKCGVYSISTMNSKSMELDFDKVSHADMESFARNLSGIEMRDTSENADIPELLSFLDMYRVSKVEDLDIYHKWLENRTYETMKAMIGQKAGGKPIYLDIHEKYHGPHGLVAGTTGSGKSETLQSYILSMAINYHPHEVSFILIDYKGGGMARSFEGLPHLAGMITNLGGNQTTRALLSINAEIKHRQRVFNEYKVKHIDQYIELYRNGEAEEAMPHLIIIADEFAELKKEQPEFVRALVSAARVGRSLGVNLILATQKPGGVVDDEIWSNTRFRISLRVADKQDSIEMLKRPDAAFITGTGRGYLQVGNDEIFDEFQSGWSGANYTPEEPFNDGSKGFVRMVDITGKPEKTGKKKKKSGDSLNKVTQLDAIVRYAGELADENGIEPVRQIWLQPLPTEIYLEDLDTEKISRKHFEIPVGLCDDPENQAQYTATVDFVRDGHLLICGGAGSGKTTLIQTIVYSASLNYTEKEVNFYIADFSGRTMTAFAGLPHTAAVCMEGEDEKISSMMEFIGNELDRRKGVLSQKGLGSFRDYIKAFDDLPMILLIIDNYAAFMESYEEYDELFVQLARDAASYGIYMVVSCNNSSDMRGRIRQGFTQGIGMQLPDRFEYDSVVGMRCEILPDDRVSGRGLIKVNKPLEFQTALPVRSDGSGMMLTIKNIISEEYKNGGNSRKISNKYEAFSDAELLNGFKDDAVFAVGKSCLNGKTVGIDTDKILVFTVGGSAGSGKTNFLKFSAKQMKKAGAKVYVFDSVLKELEGFSKTVKTDGYMTGGSELFKFMESVLVPELTKRNALVYEARQNGKSVKDVLAGFDRIAVVINSATEFMEAVYDSENDMSDFVETVFDKAAEHKIHFIMAVSPREYNDCYQYGAFRKACDMNLGIHLGGETDAQGIFEFKEGIFKKTPAGSALTVLEGDSCEVMTPFVKEGDNE